MPAALGLAQSGRLQTTAAFIVAAEPMWSVCVSLNVMEEYRRIISLTKAQLSQGDNAMADRARNQPF